MPTYFTLGQKTKSVLPLTRLKYLFTYLRLRCIYLCEEKKEKTPPSVCCEGDGDGRSQGLAVSLFVEGKGGGGAPVLWEEDEPKNQSGRTAAVVSPHADPIKAAWAPWWAAIAGADLPCQTREKHHRTEQPGSRGAAPFLSAGSGLRGRLQLKHTSHMQTCAPPNPSIWECFLSLLFQHQSESRSIRVDFMTRLRWICSGGDFKCLVKAAAACRTTPLSLIGHMDIKELWLPTVDWTFPAEPSWGPVMAIYKWKRINCGSLLLTRPEFWLPSSSPTCSIRGLASNQPTVQHSGLLVSGQ